MFPPHHKLDMKYVTPLPTDPAERAVFCMAFGDHFDGDNFDKAISFAWFVLWYQKGMKLGPWAEPPPPIERDLFEVNIW